MMRQTPMMSNPFEYRETLWKILYEGETPTPKAAPKGEGQRSLPRGRSGEMTSADKARLDAFNADIERIKEKRAAEGLPTPEIVPSRPVPAS